MRPWDSVCKGALAVTRFHGEDKGGVHLKCRGNGEIIQGSRHHENLSFEDPRVAEKVWRVRENAMRWGQEKGLKGYLAIEVNPSVARLAMTELTHITEGRSDLIGETRPICMDTWALITFTVSSLPYTWDTNKMKQVVHEIWTLEKELMLKYNGVEQLGLAPLQGSLLFQEKYGEFSYELIKKMKKLFDPNNILNRGNLEGKNDEGRD